MKTLFYINFKLLLKEQWLDGKGIFFKFFHAKDLPRITLTGIKYFHEINPEKLFCVIRGQVFFSGHGCIPEIALKAAKNIFRSLVLYPLSGNMAEGKETLREFSFSHFAMLPRNTKRIKMVSKENHTTFLTFSLKSKKTQKNFHTVKQPYFARFECPKTKEENRKNQQNRKPDSTRPMKVFMVSHNLNIEGAPKVLFEIAWGLLRKGVFLPTILAPSGGSLKPAIDAADIPLILFSEKRPDFYHSTNDAKISSAGYPSLFEILASEKPDVVFANTIENFDVVNICDILNIPVVWMIHESSHYNPQQLNFQDDDLGELYKAFLRAGSLLFCSAVSMELYQNLNFNQNFKVVPNAIIDTELNEVNHETKRLEARMKLDIPDDTIMLLHVGVINQNKNQGLIFRALHKLRANSLELYLVGARPGYAYQDELGGLIREYGFESKVKMIPLKSDISDYYRAADIFVFPSISESYPLAILEAMMYGLPIIATKVFGVNEQVKFGENALSISPDDEIGLAQKIELLLHDKDLRQRMGASSRSLFEKMPTMDDMINAHAEVLILAFNTFNQNLKKL